MLLGSTDVFQVVVGVSMLLLMLLMCVAMSGVFDTPGDSAPRKGCSTPPGVRHPGVGDT